MMREARRRSRWLAAGSTLLLPLHTNTPAPQHLDHPDHYTHPGYNYSRGGGGGGHRGGGGGGGGHHANGGYRGGGQVRVDSGAQQ